MQSRWLFGGRTWRCGPNIDNESPANGMAELPGATGVIEIMAKRSIAELTIYPIKACGGIPVTTTMLERRGLRDDRRLMVVTIDGHFVTQREHPRLALVQPQLDNARISLTAPGMSPFAFDVVATGERHG
ncbi:MAG: hypothetical protein RIS70_4203, partial [Planctomycetota bacterium]